MFSLLATNQRIHSAIIWLDLFQEFVLNQSMLQNIKQISP